MQESNSVANANKFQPKPGDKIICNNGEEFICCTLGFLHDHVIRPIKAKTILGFNSTKEVWQDWDEHGRASDYNDDHYNIQEVIPKNVEAADKKEEVKEVALYTVEEVAEAFANALPLVWMGGRKKGIEKVKDYLEKKSNKEYQEYLRLKAIYE